MNEIPGRLYCFHFIWLPQEPQTPDKDAIKILHPECTPLVNTPPGYDLLSNDRLKGSIPPANSRCELCDRPHTT